MVQTEMYKYQKLLENLQKCRENNPTEYWKMFNRLKQHRQDKTDDNNISPRQWKEYFKKLTKAEPDTDTEPRPAVPEHNIELDIDTNTSSELTSMVIDKEIYEAIRKLKNKKAPGPDGIMNEMLKNGKYFIVPLLKKAFNTILDSGIYPDAWKLSYIIPIYKSGDRNDPNNYRGITLANTTGKLFSIILNQRLKKYLDTNSPLSDLQAGFRENFRTADNIFIINAIIQHYKERKQPLYMAFIDFKKAFDTIWRKGLINKLTNIIPDHSFVNLIEHMYSENKAAVKVSRNQRSEFFETTHGVKQGDGLSPMLFNIYVDGLIEELQQSDCTPATIADIIVGGLCYADDLVIMCNSVGRPSE